MWVPGLMIIAARVAKPTIPQQLQGDFVRVEEEISKLKVQARRNGSLCFTLSLIKVVVALHESYALLLLASTSVLNSLWSCGG